MGSPGSVKRYTFPAPRGSSKPVLYQESETRAWVRLPSRSCLWNIGTV